MKVFRGDEVAASDEASVDIEAIPGPLSTSSDDTVTEEVYTRNTAVFCIRWIGTGCAWDWLDIELIGPGMHEAMIIIIIVKCNNTVISLMIN